jgi:Dienelactone hydrolase and related enzymes
MSLNVLRQEIKDYLGIRTLNFPVHYTVVDKEECDGYFRFLIYYTGSEKEIIPAYLLIPKGEGIFPAVLIHHQHNSERHLGKSEVCGLVGNPLQAFGTALVKKGFIVLAPDSICFEDRRKNKTGIVPDEENDFMQHYNEMCYRILKGSSLMKKVIDDANVGVNLLKSHEKVDKHRIGVLGHSYGGNTVIFQTATNEEIAFACSSGAACTYKNKMEYGTGIEMAEVIPGFYNKYDIYDLIKCIAPRHILLVSATNDKYSRDADFIERQTRSTFDEFGSKENFEHRRYNGGHALTLERFEDIINWVSQVVTKI